MLHSAAAACAFYALVCIAGALFLGAKPRARAPRRPALTWRVHLAVGAGVCLATVALQRIAGATIFDPDRIHASLTALGVSPASMLWLFPYYAIVNPLVEEWFWRAGVFRTLADLGTGRNGGAILLSSVLFAAWHSLVVFFFVPVWAGALSLVVIAALGALFAMVYRRTGHLGDIVLLHALVADTPLLVILVLIR